MSYTPRPGSIAERAIEHLKTLPRGAEVMTSALAEELGTPGENLFGCLEAAHKHGAIFKRQKIDGPRAPFFWSLVDHSSIPRAQVPRVVVPDLPLLDRVLIHEAQQEIPAVQAKTSPRGGAMGAGQATAVAPDGVIELQMVVRVTFEQAEQIVRMLKGAH